jgi:hypothetical protein
MEQQLQQSLALNRSRQEEERERERERQREREPERERQRERESKRERERARERERTRERERERERDVMLNLPRCSCGGEQTPTNVRLEGVISAERERERERAVRRPAVQVSGIACYNLQDNMPPPLGSKHPCCHSSLSLGILSFNLWEGMKN